jgi:hypothetical protein
VGKDDKNLIKRIFVQLHFGETWPFQWSRYFFGQLFTVAALALDAPSGLAKSSASARPLAPDV